MGRQLVEVALEATANSRAPDFEELGIELKTLPVTTAGLPVETTLVCTIPLLHMTSVEWEQPRVFRKLWRVLWVPVEGMRDKAVGERHIGTALLWSPSPEEELDLRLLGRARRHDRRRPGRRHHRSPRPLPAVRPKARDSHARRPRHRRG